MLRDRVKWYGVISGCAFLVISTYVSVKDVFWSGATSESLATLGRDCSRVYFDFRAAIAAPMAILFFPRRCCLCNVLAYPCGDRSPIDCSDISQQFANPLPPQINYSQFTGTHPAVS